MEVCNIKLVEYAILFSPVETTRRPEHITYYVLGEDIVHATRKSWKNMNKARLGEPGRGSPPF